jgi:cytochrome P450
MSANINASLRGVEDEDPFGLYAKLRDSGPVVWDPGLSGWLVLDNETCGYVLSHEELFRPGELQLRGAQELRGNNRVIATLEGDDHVRLHRFYAKLLNNTFVESRRHTLIRPIANMYVSRFVGRDWVDLGAEYAERIPTRVGIGLLGMTTGDEERDNQLAERLRTLRRIQDDWQESEGTNSTLNRSVAAAAEELRAIFMPHIRERKKQGPREDIIGTLWADGPSVFPDWSENDVLGGCMQVYAGGTTWRLLCNVMYLLVHRDGIQETLRAGPPEVTRRFVEEAIRMLGAHHLRLRTANFDVDLAGAKVKRGDRVYAAVIAANHDPAVHQCPEHMRLDADRKQHLSFGRGMRMCIGTALVRCQAVEMVTALISQFDAMPSHDVPEPPHFLGVLSRFYSPINARLRFRGASS